MQIQRFKSVGDFGVGINKKLVEEFGRLEVAAVQKFENFEILQVGDDISNKIVCDEMLAPSEVKVLKLLGVVLEEFCDSQLYVLSTREDKSSEIRVDTITKAPVLGNDSKSQDPCC